MNIRFLAARVYIEAGESLKASKIAKSLAPELQPDPQAYGKILEGETALKNGASPQAIKAFQDANELVDTWIGHFDLGRAYLEAGAFIQADSEFERCLKRRGEALSLFLDEEPTYSLLPPVYYYQGLVKEGLKSPASIESYRAYLSIRGNAAEDALLQDVRKRASR
jgi:eukaryotic-like serine/threonine-protein kinase